MLLLQHAVLTSNYRSFTNFMFLRRQRQLGRQARKKYVGSTRRQGSKQGSGQRVSSSVNSKSVGNVNSRSVAARRV